MVLEMVPADKEPTETVDAYVTLSVDSVYLAAESPDSVNVTVFAVCVADRFFTRNVFDDDVVPRVEVPKSRSAPPSAVLLEGCHMARPDVGVDEGDP